MLLSFPRSSSSSVCTGVPLVCCAARGCAPTRRLTTRPLGTAGMCAYVFALHRWLGLSLRRTSCRTRCHGWLAQSSRCCSLCHRKTGTGTPSSLSRRIRLWPEIGCHNACGDLLGQNAHCCWRQPHKTGTCSGMCRPSSLGDRTREATCAGRPRHLPLARALRGLRLRPFPVTPSRQVLPARSSLPSVRLLPLFRVGRPQQWIARAPSGGGAANAARVGSLCERRDKPTPMTRTCCIVACHSVRARAWPATQRILHEACVPRSGCTPSDRASSLRMFDTTVSLYFAPSTLPPRSLLFWCGEGAVCEAFGGRETAQTASFLVGSLISSFIHMVCLSQFLVSLGFISCLRHRGRHDPPVSRGRRQRA